jgi:hypothetical protein
MSTSKTERHLSVAASQVQSAVYSAKSADDYEAIFNWLTATVGSFFGQLVTSDAQEADLMAVLQGRVRISRRPE